VGVGGGFEAIEAEVLAQVWARHGRRSSRLTGRCWLEGCVPGSALFLVACTQLRQGQAANRCDRRGGSVQQASRRCQVASRPLYLSGTAAAATVCRHWLCEEGVIVG
jgi:hypothetical protein